MLNKLNKKLAILNSKKRVIGNKDKINGYLNIEKKKFGNNIKLNYLINKKLNNFNILRNKLDIISNYDLKENMDEKYTKEIRSTWRAKRRLGIVYKERKLNKSFLLWQQKKAFLSDHIYLKNQFQDIKNIIRFSDNNIKLNNEYDINLFIWQSDNFTKFLKRHPYLLDHLLNSLFLLRNMKNKDNYEDNLSLFLTHFWTTFFDYFNHLQNKDNKGQGISFLLAGRIKYQKKGRAKRYSAYWGNTNSSSASRYLQYTSSQIHTKFGTVGMRIFMN